MSNNFAIVTPMANEEPDFEPFVSALRSSLERIGGGKVYFVVDSVSKDNTLQSTNELAAHDSRFITVYAPENRNVVDAYLCGYREALKDGYEIIIEMDAGLSHDPRALPMFLRVLNEGNECAFGSRFINGGSIWNSDWKRTFLSKTGTRLSNILLGSKMYDMTSGYQGFHSEVVEKFLKHQFLSTGHFYQTELRYILRKSRFAEIPIHYRAPSPNVSGKSVRNSLNTLLYYFFRRLKGKSVVIE